MTKEEIQKQVAAALRGAADKIDPKPDKFGQPVQKKPATAKTQETGPATLNFQNLDAEYQTERVGEQLRSLNAEPKKDDDKSEPRNTNAG